MRSNFVSSQESFNARNYTAQKIAETFIANPEYDLLWENANSVVLGPRGSGKTTLLKMMTLSGLHNWKCRKSAQLINKRPFTSVYIPSDIHWHYQLGYLVGPNTDEKKLFFSKAAVAVSIQIAVIKTLEELEQYEGLGDQKREMELCSIIGQHLQISDFIPLFGALRAKLYARLNLISTVSNRYNLDPKMDVQKLPDFFFNEPLLSGVNLLHQCSQIYGDTHPKKWALCFDELEIAPSWLRDHLFDSQRSLGANQDILLKLTTSPIPSILNRSQASSKNDFTLIKLWDYSGSSTSKFLADLTKSYFKRVINQEIEPKEVFGTSAFAEDTDSDTYEEGSPTWHMFRDVASWDEGLRDLLLGNGINPLNPYTKSKNLRDQILRKAKPLVLIRRAFSKLRPDGQIISRSRKITEVFCGFDAILTICDGNPRTLIAILNDLLKEAKFSGSPPKLTVSPEAQARILASASVRFLHYVKALPNSSKEIESRRLDLYTVVKVLGEFFHQKIVKDTFSLDPRGTFKVDADCDPRLISILRVGLYHGVIILVETNEDLLESDLHNKRFRLSYMLAPTFKLPLRLYGKISLMSILRNSQTLRVRKVINRFTQSPYESIELPFN